jgi:hypothetical protein
MTDRNASAVSVERLMHDRGRFCASAASARWRVA